jgi:hypothetical protein
MKTQSVEDIIASFPHPILPTVQGEPDNHTIHAIHKLLQANSRSIDSHLGGGALGHLGLIVSVAAYVIVAPAHPWTNKSLGVRQLKSPPNAIVGKKQ